MPPRILMCPPDYYGIEYEINPWMSRSRGSDRDKAIEQWTALADILRRLGVQVEVMTPQPGLPDLVFTANAAVVMNRIALVARFRHPERQGEEAHFARAFRRMQTQHIIDEVRLMPDGVCLEGAGDCVWDHTRGMFWMGYGPRSDRAARAVLAECFGIETVALELADPRFYHMDTALCPLSGGELIHVPSAFTPAGLAEIHDRIAPELRIALAPEDAALLAANAVCLGHDIVLSRCSDALRRQLAERGYRVHMSPLGSFGKSGGSAFCLTLRLDQRSDAAGSKATQETPALAFG